MKIARKLLIIYFKKRNVIPRLKKFGNLIYVSKRQRYAYLYINADKLERTMDAIKRIPGVMKVEESLVEMEAYNFSL